MGVKKGGPGQVNGTAHTSGSSGDAPVGQEALLPPVDGAPAGPDRPASRQVVPSRRVGRRAPPAPTAAHVPVVRGVFEGLEVPLVPYRRCERPRGQPSTER